MKRIYLVGAAALSLIALAFAYSQSSVQSPQTRQVPTLNQQFTIEREVSTQQRINRYFHGDVVPKLRTCWGNVRGKGTIALKYTYTKAGARWMFSRVETDGSTLLRAQDTVAQKCMLDAVRGTSFPVDGEESTQDTFVLSWTWPVPFPANAAQLTSAMFAAKPAGGGSGGGGCDGHGAEAQCYVCKFSRSGASCELHCVGHENCSITAKRGGETCTQDTACASGGPFGVSGGSRVIY